jgi:hypothetical protein
MQESNHVLPPDSEDDSRFEEFLACFRIIIILIIDVFAGSENRYSFWVQERAGQKFTAVYDKSPNGNFASVRAHKNLSHCLFILNFLFIFRPVKVNAGAFNLTVGGMAINNAFYKELDAVRFTMAIFPIAYLFE